MAWHSSCEETCLAGFASKASFSAATFLFSCNSYQRIKNTESGEAHRAFSLFNGCHGERNCSATKKA